jgi:alpha/beta superfamily hydrolase
MAPRREERGVAIPLGDAGQALEGLFVAGADAGGAVIAPPHPLFGGSMDSPVTNELAHACGVTGLASLRFNWRGVGASAGRASGDNAAADEDYRAALEQLAETVEGPLVACGYSFGAATAVRIAASERRVRQLVLVAPPVELLDLAALSEFPGRSLLVTGSNDPYAPPTAWAEQLAALPRTRLEIVPEADHFFQQGLTEVGRTAVDFLTG